MKKILTVLFVAVSICAVAQTGEIKGSFDTKNFPKVSFIWNEYNPDLLESTAFRLKEDGKDVDVMAIPVIPDVIPVRDKSILFLWEDQPVRSGESSKYSSDVQTLLLKFLDKVNRNDATLDRFSFAIFNIVDNGSVFLKQFPNFTTNQDRILQGTIDEYFFSKRAIKDKKSDLLLALNEGLTLISKEPTENMRAIVVFTAGLYRYDGSMEISEIIAKSLKNRIPVYFVKLGKEDENVTYRVAKETHGQMVGISADSLFDCYEAMNTRYYGQDYQITFVSQQKRDKEWHNLTLNVGGEDNVLRYKAPKFSLFAWVKVHWILGIVFLLLTITAIVFAVIYGIKLFKYIKEKIELRKKEQDSKDAELKNLKRQIEATQRSVRDKQEVVKQKKEFFRKTEEEAELTRIMKNRNIILRLTLSNGENFTSQNAVTTIGRTEDNDLVLPNTTVSSRHATISFNGVDFEITDLGSTNGTSVNGNSIENITLRNNDLIVLGEMAMKFYV